METLDYNVLYASLIWGAIGSGYAVYGQRQRQGVPLAGGLAMIAVSYLAGSALVMSLGCIGLLVAIHVLLRRA